MRKQVRGVVAIVAALFSVFTGAGVAGAQIAMTAQVVTAHAGDTSAAVTFSATTALAMNVLKFTVSFDPSLCGMINNQKLLKLGRSHFSPQQIVPCGTCTSPAPVNTACSINTDCSAFAGSTCNTTGNVIFALIDLTDASPFTCNSDETTPCDSDLFCQSSVGGSTDYCESAVPAGTGDIAKWQFNVNPTAAGDVFPSPSRSIRPRKGRSL